MMSSTAEKIVVLLIGTKFITEIVLVTTNGMILLNSF